MTEAKDGKMAAILDLPAERINEVLNNYGLDDVIIANYNSDNQSVISGSSNSVEKAEKLLTNEGARVVMLNVSGAFHSPMMKRAEEKFKEYFLNFQFHEPNRIVISNVDAQSYVKYNIASKLASQITSPVRWTEIIRYLLDQNETEFIEIGPGNILTHLVENIRMKFRAHE